MAGRLNFSPSKMTTELLNTLFVQTQGAYLSLDNDTVRVEVEGQKRLQVPLHHLGGMAVFGNVLISPFLLQRCASDGREVTWFSMNGRFSARLDGPVSGNVLLRRAQHLTLSASDQCVSIARQFVFGKLRNTRQVLQRALREAAKPVVSVQAALDQAEFCLQRLPETTALDEIRGQEGMVAALYFSAFDDLLRTPAFRFEGRNRRPPRDEVNALLSFLYTLLQSQCTAALEGVGLDPQVGFLHAIRPGKPALALDLMEEFRAWLCDRHALALLNRKQLSDTHFEHRPGGSVYLNEAGRKTVIVTWQKRMKQTLHYQLFKEPLPIGLLMHVQARLLARHLRGDLKPYPPFLAR
jgi:CRISPR-associated protein Cas1